MTLLEIQRLAPIGSTVSVGFEGINVQCTILDAKERFGRLDVQVTPVSGAGKQWVSAERIRKGGAR